MTTFSGLLHIKQARNRISDPICDILADEDRDNAAQDGIDYSVIVDDAHARAVDTMVVVRADISDIESK